MKVKCIVTKDETKPWEMEGRKGLTRKLTCLDQSDESEHRLNVAFDLKLPKADHILAGDSAQGASIVDCMIEVSVTGIEQQERTKRITFVGDVVAILGQMKMTPWKPAAPGTATPTATGK